MNSLAPRSRRSRRRHLSRNTLELLEPRALLSGVVGYNPDGFAGFSGAYDSAGNVWFNNWNTGTLDRVVDGAIAESVTVPAKDADSKAAPSGLVSANGHLYFTDVDRNGLGGAIDDFDVANNTITVHALPVDPLNGPNFADVPTDRLTVTGDGAVWFIAAGTDHFAGTSITHTSTIGRLAPDGSFSFYDVTDFNNAPATALTAVGNEVYVAFSRSDDAPTTGTNQIGALSVGNSGIALDHLYAVNTGDAAADSNGYLTSITATSDGTVWFSLANTSSPAPGRVPPADRLVRFNASGDLSQTAFILLDSDVPLAVNRLTVDGSGHVWFVEVEGNRAGYFDPSNDHFTPFDLPPQPDGTPTTGPVAVVVSKDPGITDAWVATNGTGYSLLKIPGQITFSGVASDVAAVEDKTLDPFVLATFTGVSGQTYTATITWGNGTTSTLQATDMEDNSFALLVSGKSFVNPGTFASQITIRASDGSIWGTLGFQTVVTDTPLTVTSYDVTPLAMRVVTATLTFTDDVTATAKWFTVSINWGDGTSSKGVVIPQPNHPGTFLVLSVHNYKKRGTYTVSTNISTTELNAVVATPTISTTVTV